MEEGDGTLHCGNYTKCDPIPILNSESRAATSVGEENERENGKGEVDVRDEMGVLEGNGKANVRMEDVRGGTPWGKHPSGWRRWWREDSDGIHYIWMPSPREAAA